MNYILVIPDDGLDHKLYADLSNVSDVTTLYLENYKGNLLKRLHTSLKINSYVDLPAKKIHYKKLFEYMQDNTWYIFSHVASAKIGKSILRKLQNGERNIHIALVLLDSFQAHSVTLFQAWRAVKDVKWDAVLSYDIEDCRQYGFTFLGYTYYSKLDHIISSNHFSDIYFVGANKKGDDRFALVKQCMEYFAVNEVKSRFIIVDRFKEHNINNESIEFHRDYIPYADVISDVLASNCILEILQCGQYQQSARYFEAVCYNKKLLTNNPHISELPFYDARYMKYFSEPKDIDIEWIKQKEDINYHYNGEFSSAKIIDKLQDVDERAACRKY